MTTAVRSQVSDWDREYMRRLGRYKAESHKLATQMHLQLSPNERLVDSFAFARTNYHWPTWSLRVDDDPAEFYEVAKRLGCYRP